VFLLLDLDYALVFDFILSPYWVQWQVFVLAVMAVVPKYMQNYT